MPGRVQLKPSINFLIILFLSGIFAWSGLQKLLNPEAFGLALYRYHLVPHAVVNLAALWIMWVELVCAFCLLFLPRFRFPALVIIMGLLCIFTVAIGISIFQGNHVACGCFSSSPMAHSLGWVGIFRNLFLIFLTVFLQYLELKNARVKQLGAG